MTAKKAREPEVINIDSDYALVKAAQALDRVLEMAGALNDSNTALGVANAWMTMAALLDEEQMNEEIKNRIGFYHDE